MLLAFGPLLLDTAAGTIVVGVRDAESTDDSGAHAVWLRHPTPDLVASTVLVTGLPVGVTVHDVGALDELVAAGATAIECASPATAEFAGARDLTMWCLPTQAVDAVDAGVPAERIVCESGAPQVPSAIGATVAGRGPGAWGAVVRAVHAGAGVVRTTDLRSVRRVVTVTDRLVAARGGAA